MTTTQPRILFPGAKHGGAGEIRTARYGNQRIALVVLDDGSRTARTGQISGGFKLTVNLPDEALDDDEVAIKDYSENEGVLAALIGVKVVAPPHRFVPSINGHVQFPICRLLVQPRPV